MGMMLTLFALAAAATTPDTGGFRSRDPGAMLADARGAFGPGTIARVSDGELLVTCPDCAGAPSVTVTVARQEDGTEQRVRSGATTIAMLQAQCQARAPDCTIAALSVAPAVGWVSAYRLGDDAGATAVVLRGGDRLVMRSLAADAATARRSIDQLLPVARAKLIGMP